MALKSRSGCPHVVFAFLLILIIVFPAAITAFAQDPQNENSQNREEREQWFLRGRQYRGGISSRMLERARQQRDALRLQSQSSKNQQMIAPNATGGTTPVWTTLGPAPLRSVEGGDQDYGPVIGRATTVVVDQNDLTGNTVYLGGAYGGVWKSINAANSDLANVSWQPLIDDQPTISVGAIAVKPDNGNVLLIGTGEANSSTDSYYGLGILRSTNGGQSWTSTGSANNGLRPFHGLAFAKIAFSSDNPNLVVAATASASEGLRVGAENPASSPAACANPAKIATCRGLYYSLDAGLTWNQATLVDPGPSTPDNGSFSSVVYNAAQHKFYAAGRAHGFYVSSDGITFTRMGSDSFSFKQPNAASLSAANCPASPANLASCPLYRGEIAVVPGRDEMYVWYVDSSSTPVNGGIYQTLDGGKTWTALNTSGVSNCGDSYGCGTEQGGYNLALMAIPNGATATDLYAGAINIYRCQLSSINTACSTTGFINLTHAYGCAPAGSFSKVHPNQHGFDFLQSNPNLAFFANDGGIYRTLAALNANGVPGSCPTTPPATPFYPYENLNGTMGSMMQFVWFAQHPSDQHTLLGGTPNGSPTIDATDSGSNGLTWRTALAGDGGYSEINAANGDEWFASNPRVNVFRCSAGASCLNGDFQQVLNSAKLDGDSSAFYMPYLLDPQDSTKLIAGTCRVWRTSTTGAAGVALSQNFATGVLNAACASGASTFISALAAGGPTTSSGSQVIYAGTEDGRVFVTTSAVSSATMWTTVSANPGFSNPNGYVISSIGLDPRDVTGKTAFVTVMGFGTSHVFRTTNAGNTWSDVSGNIPDAPANAVVVDKNTGTVYAGTDVGVFSTDMPNGSTTVWTEVGPASGAGALPNVAVTRLAIFAPSGAPARLRASTYGRGMWETTLSGSASVPDYTLSIGNPNLIAAPGQTVTFNGSLTAINGYNHAVTISCEATSDAGPLPSTCTSSPASPNPATTSNFSVSVANNGVGDFSFRVMGVGSDPNNLPRQAAVHLRVVDFSLSSSASSVPDLLQGASAKLQLIVNSLGSFDQQVTFACTGLPAGITCSASPVNLTSGGTAQSTLTIAAGAAVPAGTYNFNIVGTWAAASRTQTQPVTVTVIVPASDYALDFSSTGNATVDAGGTANGNLTITALGSFHSSVDLTVAGCPLNATCSVNPATVSPTSTNAASSVLTITTKSNSSGQAGTPGGVYNIVVTGTSGAQLHSASYTLMVNDFLLSGSGSSVTVAAGKTATGTFSVSASGSFNSTVNFTLSGCPSNATCSVSPVSVIPASNTPATVTLTVATKAPSVASLYGSPHNYLALWMGLSLGACGIVILKRPRGVATFLVITCLLFGMASCGGGGGNGGGGGGSTPVPVPGTPAGNYTIVVTGTAGTTVKTANFLLTVQ